MYNISISPKSEKVTLLISMFYDFTCFDGHSFTFCFSCIKKIHFESHLFVINH